MADERTADRERLVEGRLSDSNECWPGGPRAVRNAAKTREAAELRGKVAVNSIIASQQ